MSPAGAYDLCQMDLLSEWRRRSSEAALGAVVAPLAILVAGLAVGLGGGGFGGFGALRQAIEGPKLPSVTPLSQQRKRDDAGRLLARVRRDGRGRGAAAASADGGGGGRDTSPRTPTAPGDSGGDGPSSPVAVVDPGGGTGVPGAPVPTAPPSEPTDPQPPAEPSGPIHQTGEVVTDITDGVPVVGEPVGQVVDGLADALEPPPQ